MNDVEKVISRLEEKLRLAMLFSDVRVLDQLLSDALLFTDQFGYVRGKSEDIELYRRGILLINRLDQSERSIRCHENLIVVSVRTLIEGTYELTPFSADLRFTRCWARYPDDLWCVLTAHSSIVADPALPSE